MSGPNIIKRTFQSSSGSGTYTTMIDSKTGATGCDCKGWIFKRGNKPRSCRHTKELEAEFGFGASVPASVSVAAAAPALHVVTPQQKKAGQKAVLDEFARVKGKRLIEIEDEDEPEAPANGSMSVSKPKMASQATLIEQAGPPSVKPMLASALREDQTVKSFETPEWALEEKIDGHRVFLRVFPDKTVEGWSRPNANTGKPALPREIPPHIKAEAVDLPAGLYDGEMYVPGGTSSDVGTLSRAHEQEYMMFDVLEVLGMDTKGSSYCERRGALTLAWKHCPGQRIKLAESKEVSADTLQAIWDRGGEGAIVKRLASKYVSGWRSPDWVKLKKIDAAELVITGFVAGKRGPFSVVSCRHVDGRETTVPVIDNETMRDCEKRPDWYIGKTLVISHMGFSSSGIWRHSVWDHIKEGS